MANLNQSPSWQDGPVTGVSIATCHGGDARRYVVLWVKKALPAADLASLLDWIVGATDPVFASLGQWDDVLAADLCAAGARYCVPHGDSVVEHLNFHLAQHPIPQEDGALRWRFNLEDGSVLLSPRLASFLNVVVDAAWPGLEAFLIAISGLAARDLLTVCRTALRDQRRLRLVHGAPNPALARSAGPYVAHQVAGATTHALAQRYLFGQMSADVPYADVVRLQQKPGVLTEEIFKDKLSAFLNETHRRAGLSAAVCTLSIDRFDQMNILLGRHIADELLGRVAQRLRDCVDSFRAVRGEADTRDIIVCRMGGAQFAIALEGALLIKEAQALADAVLEEFKEPFVFLNQRLHLAARIGIAAGKAGERSADKLLSRANLALSVALKDPPGTARVFDAHDAALAQEKVILDGELRDALEREGLFIRYMPIVHLATGQVAGFEALVRWDHPEMGQLTPELFIPMAEESGVIADVGDWVLRHALGEFAIMASELPPDVYLAINISPEQLRRGDLMKDVLGVLALTGLAERRLMLEVTESLLIEDFGPAKEMMLALQARGIRFSIDDFGTGFSALAYLDQLPFDELKLDRRFVRALVQDDFGATSKTLVEAVLAIAQTHNAVTVAEGIETAQQAHYLERSGCQLGQGYHFSEPMAAKDVPAFVAELAER